MSVGEKGLTVNEYCRQFFERTANSGGAESDEEVKLAGQRLYNLLLQLKEAGGKDDIKVPLRVLRDEVGRLYFGGARQRTEKIEILFKLFDALEIRAQSDLRSGKQTAAAAQILEELRQRFSRLVIGDTWDAWPELKLVALKRMHTYSLREKQAAKEAATVSPPPTPTVGGGRLGMRKLSRTFSGAINTPVNSTWQSSIDDLAKAPGSRLLPMLKLLLVNSAEITDFSDEAKAGLTAETASGGASNRASSDILRPQPSGMSEPPELNRRVADLDMDDLLGLSDAKAGSEAQPEVSQQAGAPDPFSAAAAAARRPSGDYSTAAVPPSAAVAGREGNGTFHQQGYPAVLHSQYSGSTNGAYSSTLTPQGSYSKPLSPHASFGQQPRAPHTYVNRQQAEPSPFQESAFVPSSAPITAGHALGANLQRLKSSGSAASDQPGGFNPFGLPSPRFSSPVAAQTDNSFANFSPVAAAPPAPPPQPMRAPPQPPSAQAQSQQQQSARPPASFSAW